MNPQHAHRLAHALSQHGENLLGYLDEFARTGYCGSAMYLYIGTGRLTIGMNSYDMRAVVYNREQARRLHDHIRKIGVPTFYSNCLVVSTLEDLKVNIPEAVVSRSFKHRPSQLHTSNRTRKAQHATHRGRQDDVRRAADFNRTCSAPSMMSHGRHKDRLPVTIHTPKAIGANVA